MNLQRILAVAALGMVLIMGFVAYSIFKAPATANGPIEAIPLASTQASSAAEASAQAADESEAAAASEAAEQSAAAEASPAPPQPRKPAQRPVQPI